MVAPGVPRRHGCEAPLHPSQIAVRCAVSCMLGAYLPSNIIGSSLSVGGDDWAALGGGFLRLQCAGAARAHAAHRCATLQRAVRHYRFAFPHRTWSLRKDAASLPGSPCSPPSASIAHTLRRFHALTLDNRDTKQLIHRTREVQPTKLKPSHSGGSTDEAQVTVTSCH